MSINMNDIADFDAFADEIRCVYDERDGLRDEVEDLRRFKKDICEVLGIGGNSHNDGIVKLLKANKARTSMEADNNRMYREILDEIKKYFKMTASHWKYYDIPRFVKTAHEFALEKKEDAEDALLEFGEDICAVIGINYDMSTDATILSEIKSLKADKDSAQRSLLDAKTAREYQEQFTEEAASILGVHPGDLSLSDILEALRKLKREEKLDDMNSSIIAALRTERDKLQHKCNEEKGRRINAEKYISDTFQRAAKELGMTCIPDGIDRLCDEIADLRNYRNRISCPKDFWEAMCGVMEMDACAATPSDVFAKTKETKLRLISILALNPDTATWTDIYDGIKAEQKDHCDLISESYKMRNELEKLKKKSEDNKQSFVFSSVCDYLGIAADDATLLDIRKEIEELQRPKYVRAIELIKKRLCDILGMDAGESTVDDVITEVRSLNAMYHKLDNNVKNGDILSIKQLEQDKKALKRELDHTDERRRHWVRRYKEEHEKAVNLDKLYREWKDKYETYYKHTSNMTEQNESLMASYMAIKNTAIKQKDILKVVCRYLAGKDTMPDKDIVIRLNEMWTKEIGWDGLVEHYGGKAIRELVDACDDEITENAREDLDEMLST